MRDCDTIITKVDCDWIDVKNECRTTANKVPTMTEATHHFKWKLLISEHSPIRLLRIKWRWPQVKSWVATHFSRHWLGFDKWVGTRRTEWLGRDRSELPQGELVPMSVCANAQALINVSRYRLCYRASAETREYIEDVKQEVHKSEPEISNVMVPNCVYRCGCPEISSCGFFDTFKKKHSGIDFTSIEERYKAYNEDFYQGGEKE